MGGNPLFPREDRGTDRIPTTMRRSAKRKRCPHVKALKSTAAFAIRNTRPDSGTGGKHPRPATEKLSGKANVRRRPTQGDGLQVRLMAQSSGMRSQVPPEAGRMLYHWRRGFSTSHKLNHRRRATFANEVEEANNRTKLSACELSAENAKA